MELTWSLERITRIYCFVESDIKKDFEERIVLDHNKVLNDAILYVLQLSI